MIRITIQIFKIMTLAIVSIILLLLIIAAVFVNTSPEFGGNHSEDDIKRFEATGHYEDGKFVNLIPTSMDMSPGKMFSTMLDFIKGVPNARPDFEIPLLKIDSLAITQWDEPASLVWFGHSAFLLQLDGENILIDPMFGDTPAPHPWLGNKRYSNGLPIELAKLPEIDAIIFSHDHYDHLDYGSIQKLKDKTKSFYVPMGVATHLIKWGVPAEKIHELNWWDEIQHKNIQLVLTPARHFSGRGLNDRSTTLWGSWVIKGEKNNLYFSGDSGYGPHFKAIGEKYGPFDFAMMECGQYNINWSQIHMMPEETAQAAVDIDAKMMMPIHWGAFTLALHSWTDPVERVIKKTNELGMPLLVPIIGELIVLDSNLQASEEKWWLNKKAL